MTEFALVNQSTGEMKRISGSVDPTVQTRAPWVWMPIVRNAAPVINEATQTNSPTQGVVGESYVFGWSTRAKTADEQAAYIQSADTNKLRGGVLDSAEILITLVDVLIAKGVITAGDISLATRAKYQSFKASVDRLR